MKKLKIDCDTAILIFNNSNDEGKRILTEQFGAEMFVPVPVMERIKTFEDALLLTGDSPNKFINSCAYLSKDEIAYRKLKIIIAALNEGWVPDWTDSNQYKYWPYFKYTSGFGLGHVGTHHRVTFTIAGSRLLFKSSELAEYAAKQFKDIYNDYLTIS